jgi:alkanesulfonate monooxygenase SsuD/methylene tetrahydromethanopterin reductase-like flavin-dependent oxidoreductase (luciferase family)
MRFQVLDIVPHAPHPVTGEIISVHERLQRVVENAVLAERLGFDSYAVGERHAGEFVSSAPTVLLGALAQATDRILLSTGVTVLSLLDPVRVAEDYATVDQLSGGRLEIVIGKGTRTSTSRSSGSTSPTSTTTSRRTTSCCAGSYGRRTSPGPACTMPTCTA